MRRRGTIGAVLVMAAGFASRPVLVAQTAPTPQSKVTAAVRVNVVNVEVFVEDVQGRPVRGLTAADFELREDKAPVAITNFFAAQRETAEVPADRAQSQGSEPGAPPPEEQALSLVVFVDNANISYVGRKTVFESLSKVLGGMLRPGDRVMVVSFDRWLKERTALTPDPSAALAALSALGKEAAEGVLAASERERLLRQIADAARVVVTNPIDRNTRALEPDTFTVQKILESIESLAQQQYNASRSELGELGRLIDSLAGLPGHKVMLYVSEGIAPRPCEELFVEWEKTFPVGADTLQRQGKFTSPGVAASRYSVTPELRELGRRANAGRVTFITVDAGAYHGMEGTSAAARVMTAQAGLAGMEALSRQQSLLGFAAATGGRSLINTPSLEKALVAAADDFHAYYSLGYSPDHFGDGAYHRITVTVKRPDVKVRNREGYLDKPPEQRLLDRTAAALLGGDSHNPLGLVVKIGVPTLGQGSQLLVPFELSVPASGLTLLPQGDNAEGRLSACFVVRDEEGRTSHPQRIAVPLLMQSALLEGFRRQNASFTFQLMMREGRQHVAVTLQDEITEESSTVVTEVNVPSRASLERTGT